MRLWHEALLPVLPRAQLLGQHRECCALRGNSWNKPHSIVNYVFEHEPYRLVLYHFLIMDEMKNRGYNVDPLWYDPYYRGKVAMPWTEEQIAINTAIEQPLYKEHNKDYLIECINNLKGKGIHLEFDLSSIT